MFSGIFSPRGKTSLLQEQILSFRVQISFPFRADPIPEKFLSRKANRKSQKLLYLIKMAKERGTVSSYLNVYGYTTVLYRLFCKGDSRIIYAGKGWEVNSFRKKMFRENRMRKNSLTSISRNVVRCPIKGREGSGGVRGDFCPY